MPVYLIILLLGFLFPAESSVTVRLEISSTAKPEGVVYVAAYVTPQAFADERPDLTTRARWEGRTAVAELTLPRAGRYVIAGYHDCNGNEEMDNNFFGAPTEPYGFTTSPASKWARPDFADIATTVNEATTLKMGLRTWKEY